MHRVISAGNNEFFPKLTKEENIHAREPMSFTVAPAPSTQKQWEGIEEEAREYYRND